MHTCEAQAEGKLLPLASNGAEVRARGIMRLCRRNWVSCMHMLFSSFRRVGLQKQVRRSRTLCEDMMAVQLPESRPCDEAYLISIS
jgi:hypothetical protein